MNKLEQIVSFLDIFKLVFLEDVKFAVFDKEKLVADLPGEIINMKGNIGDPLSLYEGTVSYKAIQEQRFIREERGPEKFNVAYIATAIPIFDNGEFLGVLTAMVSNQRISIMKREASKLSNLSVAMSISAAELSHASNELAHQIHEIFSQSEVIMNDVNKSNRILGNVYEIAENSKLLGLNATIEAARIGELGRGFEIVASEVRKMADYSKTLANDIDDQMKRIQSAIKKMHDAIQNVADITQVHSARLQDMNSAFQEILITSEELVIASEFSG